MNYFKFSISENELLALPSGALWWPDQSVLCVSDLHFGKSNRLARKGQSWIPPYENQDTLLRLEKDLDATNTKKMQTRREWIWISGNHDPSPKKLGGTFLESLEIEKLNFQHIASSKKRFEISGHYHPKIRVRVKHQSFTRRCFLVDDKRVIMPAYGTYTGGLYCNRDPLRSIMNQNSIALMTGKEIYPVPISKAN